MRAMRRGWFIGLAALACATGAAAQVPRVDQARTVFTPGRLVRVSLDARQLEGRVASFNDSLVVLRHGSRLERVAVVEADTVWTAKRANRKGAAIGAVVVGAGIGLFAAAMIGTYCDSADGCAGSYVPVFFMYGAVGAATGAALGAGVGAMFRTWERAWP
ncbi:MAG: hypothetical protein JNL26_05435 [Gemmatimonadetes bacterium]|nr:hypothetical protein [Gemmatimonadota bacterium]